VLHGSDGVYFADTGDDALRRVTDAAAVVHASGAHVLIGDDDGLTAYDLVTGEASASFPVACGTTDAGDARVVMDAALAGADADGAGGTLLAACRDVVWDNGVLMRAEADGTWTQTAVAAARLALDRGDAYAIASYGREGETITPIDPRTGEALGDPRWSGFTTATRGDTWSYTSGEPGNSESGDVVIRRWSDAASELRVPLEADAFPTTADVLDGVAMLVTVYEWSDDGRSTRLLGPDGAEIDRMDGGCDHGALAWLDDGPRLVAWCPAPLRRITWTWERGGWLRTEERAFTEAVSAAQLVEAGD
jgi:hypothetical protein